MQAAGCRSRCAAGLSGCCVPSHASQAGLCNCLLICWLCPRAACWTHRKLAPDVAALALLLLQGLEVVVILALVNAAEVGEHPALVLVGCPHLQDGRVKAAQMFTLLQCWPPSLRLKSCRHGQNCHASTEPDQEHIELDSNCVCTAVLMEVSASLTIKQHGRVCCIARNRCRRLEATMAVLLQQLIAMHNHGTAAARLVGAPAALLHDQARTSSQVLQQGCCAVSAP